MRNAYRSLKNEVRSKFGQAYGRSRNSALNNSTALVKPVVLSAEMRETCAAMGYPTTRDEIKNFYSNEAYVAYMAEQVREKRPKGYDIVRVCMSYLGTGCIMFRYSKGKTEDPRDFPDEYNQFLRTMYIELETDENLDMDTREENANTDLSTAVKNIRNANRDQVVESMRVRNKKNGMGFLTVTHVPFLEGSFPQPPQCHDPIHVGDHSPENLSEVQTRVGYRERLHY